MIEDDENRAGLTAKQWIGHEIGQPLDSLSVAEIGERIELLKAEITRLEEARHLKQDAQAAAAAFFKI
jgi:uncharacterized small protein (DUF1192 family)